MHIIYIGNTTRIEPSRVPGRVDTFKRKGWRIGYNVMFARESVTKVALLNAKCLVGNISATRKVTGSYVNVSAIVAQPNCDWTMRKEEFRKRVSREGVTPPTALPIRDKPRV